MGGDHSRMEAGFSVLELKEIILPTGHVVLVDDADFEWLSKFRWCLKRHKDGICYTSANVHGKTAVMHRVIMNPPEGFHVDHINHNGLDNQRENLRLVSKGQNQRHRKKFRSRLQQECSSKYIGVSFHKKAKKWVTQIRVDGKVTIIGMFADEKEAALARDDAARLVYGIYGTYNFPRDGETSAFR